MEPTTEASLHQQLNQQQHLLPLEVRLQQALLAVHRLEHQRVHLEVNPVDQHRASQHYNKGETSC